MDTEPNQQHMEQQMEKRESTTPGINLGELPEECIANIISCTSPSPPDACGLSEVSKSFRSAADSNLVWERLLPPDYLSMICSSHEPSDLLSLPSRKELFVSLCHNPIVINGETKSFWLDKWTGKKCYMLSARDLKIAWRGTSRHLHRTRLPDSRFKEVAKVVFGWGLEIRGTIDTSLLSPFTTYAAYLVFKWSGRPNGFDLHNTEVSVGVSGSRKMNKSIIRLARDDRKRRDGWLEVELGERCVGSEKEGEVLVTGVGEGEAAKGGLFVEGIEIRPKAPMKASLLESELDHATVMNWRP